MSRDTYDFWAERLTPEDDAAVGEVALRFATCAASVRDAFSRDEFATSELMLHVLEPLGGRLFWELSSQNGGIHLAITPELNHEMRPLARAVKKALSGLSGLEVCDARPAVSFEDIEVLLAARLNEPVELRLAECEANEFRSIDIRGAGKSKYSGSIAEVVFSLIVGEGDERDWLGSIETTGEKKSWFGRFFQSQPLATSVVLERFAVQVNDLLSEMKATRLETLALPDNEAAYSMFSFSGESNTGPRGDLVTLMTMHRDYSVSRRSSLRHSPVRFVSNGEFVGGLQIERTDEHPFDDVTARTAIEDAFDAMLRPAGGGVFGGGHGLQHVYIDFAAPTPDLALAICERLVAELKFSAPAYMIFDDAGLEALRAPVLPASVQ